MITSMYIAQRGSGNEVGLYYSCRAVSPEHYLPTSTIGHQPYAIFSSEQKPTIYNILHFKSDLKPTSHCSTLK